MDPNMTMGMQMTFYFGYPLRLLFASLHIQTAGGMVAAVLVSLVMAALYEGLKSLRDWMLYWSEKQPETRHRGVSYGSDTSNEKFPLLAGTTEKSLQFPTRSSLYVKVRAKKHFLCLVFLHLLQGFLHVVQVGLGFLLMLVAMTYNGWLFLAVCFGAGVGYLLFAKLRNINSFKEHSDPCH